MANLLPKLIVTSSLLLLISCYPQQSDKFLYFAYGSNLLKSRILIHNPSAKFFGVGKLEGYRLDFNMFFPDWDGACATIVPDAEAEVYGPLWTMDSDQVQNIDKQEGVDQGWYFARNVTVNTSEGPVVARTYQETVNPDKLAPGEHLPKERRPSNTYLQVIINGATECHLPPDYINYLNKFDTNGNIATKALREKLGYPFNEENLQPSP